MARLSACFGERGAGAKGLGEAPESIIFPPERTGRGPLQHRAITLACSNYSVMQQMARATQSNHSGMQQLLQKLPGCPIVLGRGPLSLAVPLCWEGGPSPIALERPTPLTGCPIVLGCWPLSHCVGKAHPSSHPFFNLLHARAIAMSCSGYPERVLHARVIAPCCSGPL